MRIFKFGGASVKDANGVKNIVSLLRKVGHNDTLIVVSAMGKTTNGLEQVLHCYFHQKKELQSTLQDIKKYHNGILLDLFEDENHPVFKRVSELFNDLDYVLKKNKSPDYNFVYDQVVSFGELVSTTIISFYLKEAGLRNIWIDVRELLKTDAFYRHAHIDWARTQQNIQRHINPQKLYITQGFLGSDANNFTTTLGREGSDYTAAIFAYCLNAESVTIWKDVPGVLNADPRYFENARLLDSISYTEAIELAFYGASVIHPKTLQPLQRKEIPLFVKSFLKPLDAGTTVTKGIGIKPHTPCFILKKDMVLVSLSTLDFSYVVEENISAIFALLHQYKMKVGVIQNSAISFSVCFENPYDHIEPLLQALKATFKVQCHLGVSLYTIRHFNQEALAMVEQNKTILLKQILGNTVQLVVK